MEQQGNFCAPARVGAASKVVSVALPVLCSNFWTHSTLPPFRVELDEDIPAFGKYYCTPCSRYFINATALAAHNATKPHKKRCKELDGPRPHNQGDAEWAAGMGATDNGNTGFGMSLE